MDVIDVETVVSRLRNHFDSVDVGAPIGDDYWVLLQVALPSVPGDLLRFYEHCNGIAVGLHDTVVGRIFSGSEMLAHYPIADDLFPITRLLPLRSDGCGDYDCLVTGAGPAENSVVFWDHEIGEAPAYLLGSSLLSYLDMWSDNLIHCYLPDGRYDERFNPPSIDHWPFVGEPEERHPWPFDEKWMIKRDPAIRDLLASAQVKAWLLQQDP